MFTEKKIKITISIWSDTEFGVSSTLTQQIERLLDSKLDDILNNEINTKEDLNYNVEVDY